MSSIRTAAVLVILAVIVTGISMANKPNEGTDPSITVSPSTLMLSRDIGCVTIHSNIPYGSVLFEEDEPLLSLQGIPGSDPNAPCCTKADLCGDLVAKFDGDMVRDIVAPGQVILTLSGLTTDGAFSASDTIRVKD